MFLASLLVGLPAQATTFELGGTLGADFNLGADTILELEYDDGSDQEIKAGNGVLLSLAAGALFFDHQPHQLETVLSLGLKYSTMEETENAGLDFLRLPIDLLAFYRNEDWFFRAGGGLVWYPSSSLTGSGALPVDLSFDAALGGIAQVEFIYEGWSVGLRYTALSLTPSGTDVSLSANSLGGTLSYLYRFGGPAAE
ncbi:MAG TPA: hypothetical protein VJU61_02350 [Polyangiaceae bacterium]|nr:hypothetical protein [Polyangiaceae bacterium]